MKDSKPIRIGLICVSKKSMRNIKNDVKRHGSCQVINKYGRVTTILKRKKSYYELESGRKVTTISKRLLNGMTFENTPISNAVQEVIKSGGDIKDIEMVADDVLENLINIKTNKGVH